MSYALRPDARYRMPTHFGPSPGPRQSLDQGTFANIDAPTATGAWVRWECPKDRVSTLLPAGFEPADQPEMTVEFRSLTDIPWLAGRGYNIAFVYVSAVWTGGAEPIAGQFQLVVWESRADPIITGRDELGIPKLYAEVSELDDDGATITARAAWDGFTFLELQLTSLSPAPADASAIPHNTEPSFLQKYVPATGGGREWDVNYAVMTPVSGNRRVLSARAGTGRAGFTEATWQQLPTLVNVVNALAAFNGPGEAAAGAYCTVGASDLREQVRLS